MATIVQRLFGTRAPVYDRQGLVATVERELGGEVDPLHLRALLEVPRELFVRAEDVAQSTDDVPLALDDEGLATISAPHAYLLSFRLLRLGPGDRLIELGSGSGYGAALAAKIVGPTGRVVSIEIDPALARWAATLLARVPNVSVVGHDAMNSISYWNGANKIVCTFAVASIPRSWLDALHEGDVLVAPVGHGYRNQRLVRITRTCGHLSWQEHGSVRYVRNRSRIV